MINYKEEKYTRVYKWMADELKLDKTNLLIYALIFGLTQNGEEWFRGSREFMAEFCGVKVQTIDNNINKLIKMDLIIRGPKTKLGIVRYKCNPKFIQKHIPIESYNKLEGAQYYSDYNIEQLTHNKKTIRTY